LGHKNIYGTAAADVVWKLYKRNKTENENDEN
jgi:hypothetical protein